MHLKLLTFRKLRLNCFYNNSVTCTPIFGRLFVKRFALCYPKVVLSVTMVYCGQTVGWIKMKLGTEVGLDPGHIVLDGDLAPQKGTQSPILDPCLLWPTAGWIKMPLGTEVYFGLGDIVLHGDPRKGYSIPLFSASVYCGRTVVHLSYCWEHL